MTCTTRVKRLIWVVAVACGITFLSTPLGALAATPSIDHKVVSGDTLYDLARQYKTTIDEIAAINDMDPDDILRLGKTIKIPVDAVAVEVADTEVVPEPVEPAAAAAPEEVRLHTIVSGDTLTDLAARYGCTIWAIAEANDMSTTSILRVGKTLRIPAADVTRSTPLPSRSADGTGAVPMPWDDANRLFVVGAVAQIIDVRTGETFNIRRHGGTLHADVEPVTKEDVAVMRKLWGGPSWSRRPVVVVYDGYRIAGSMNGMPHGRESIGDNGILGHVCLHFLNSRLHLNKKVDPTHQAAVREATGR